MGYDNGNLTVAIPLYFIYTPIVSYIYHVNNPSSTYSIGSGYDNIACGHYNWPCETMTYALEQCTILHPNPSPNERKIGVINEYEMNEELIIPSGSTKILI
jgi:hypothetical protein